MTDGPTIFTRIIQGELPGRFVWREPDVVAFLTIAPIRPGHTLVVPVEPYDKWTDVPPATWQRVAEVSRVLGRAIDAAFECDRVGVMVAGLEVPHCHVHLVPIRTEGDLDFRLADHDATPEDLDAAAEAITAQLIRTGSGPPPPR